MFFLCRAHLIGCSFHTMAYFARSNKLKHIHIIESHIWILCLGFHAKPKLNATFRKRHIVQPKHIYTHDSFSCFLNFIAKIVCWRYVEPSAIVRRVHNEIGHFNCWDAYKSVAFLVRLYCSLPLWTKQRPRKNISKKHVQCRAGWPATSRPAFRPSKLQPG